MATTPNLENMRKQAKGLHRQLQAGAAQAVARLRAGLPRLSAVAAADIPTAGVTLQEVQHVIAVEQGFHNWKQLLEAAGTRQPGRMRSTLYIRPGLPNVRREVDWLLSMVGRGKGWSMDRIRRGLPRVAGMSDEEIAKAGVTLEESRQVVAQDYGFPDWATLEGELRALHPVETFEDFAELEDHEIRQVIFRAGRDRLAVALKAVTDRLRERFRANMSSQAWEALTRAMEELGPMPLSAVEVEQARFLQKYRSDDPVV